MGILCCTDLFSGSMICEITTEILPDMKGDKHLTQHFDNSFSIKLTLHTEKTGTSPFNWHENFIEAFDGESLHFIMPRVFEILN